MAIALSVNLNKIALIRNSRPGNFPDVTAHGKHCLEAGAAGLTVHPRSDLRHIRPHDVYELADLIANWPPSELSLQPEFNIEGNPFLPATRDYPGFLKLVEDVCPAQCTLVPDSTSQLTSDHGFDMVRDSKRLEPIISRLKSQGIRVCLFLDPDPEQIKGAKEAGADRIELYTGPYADAFKNNSPDLKQILDTYEKAAKYAVDIGLGVNAGHDLNLTNLPAFSQIPGLLEVSIGHALTVDALNMGLSNAVKAYNTICQKA